jgi:hypothetical protein
MKIVEVAGKKYLELASQGHYLVCKVSENDKWIEVIYQGFYFDPLLHIKMVRFEELTLGAEWDCSEDVLIQGKNWAIKEIPSVI